MLSAAGAPAAKAERAPAHWRVRTVTIRDETGSSAHRQALEHAAWVWSAAGAKITLKVVDGAGGGCAEPAAGSITVCGYTSARSAGEATTTVVDGHIERAVVRLELHDLTAEHLRAVACHEIGHALGLDHREGGTTCMTSPPTSTEPDEHDLRAVRAAHAHDDPARRCEGAHLVRVGSFCLFRWGS